MHFLYKITFEIPEGAISDFAVHPSEEFVCITSSIGSIYLYHLVTGKLCTVIQCDHHCVSVKFDPSVLYLCCVLITDIRGGFKGR